MSKNDRANRAFAKKLASLPNKDTEEPIYFVSDMYLSLKPLLPRPLTRQELLQMIPHAKRA